MIFIGKRLLTFFLSGIFIMGFSISTYYFGIHPNMNNWKQERILITDVNTDEKVVALTFDDGPDAQKTAAVLDALARNKARATFFVVGNRAEKQEDLLKRIAQEGHELGNHSYSHANFNHKSKRFIQDEIRKGNEVIFRITGQRPTLFRPPGGYLSYQMVDLLRQEHMTIAYWTYQQDSKDWRNKKAKQIADHILTNLKPGQIIILHDGAPNGMQTARALDLLIPELKKQGYRMVTISELIEFGQQE